jgi:NAD/NADP transhydrogenase alpha subunit
VAGGVWTSPPICAHTLVKVLGTIAVAFGTANVVGGFLVTQRQLGMFRRSRKPTRKG